MNFLYTLKLIIAKNIENVDYAFTIAQVRSHDFERGGVNLNIIKSIAIKRPKGLRLGIYSANLEHFGSQMGEAFPNDPLGHSYLYFQLSETYVMQLCYFFNNSCRMVHSRGIWNHLGFPIEWVHDHLKNLTEAMQNYAF